MAIIEKHFDSGHVLTWSWPLEVGVYDPDGQWTTALAQLHYTNRLCRLHALPGDAEFVSLMLVAGGLESFRSALETHEIYFPQGGIILVCEPELPVPDTELPDDNAYVQGLHDLAWRTSASGIFHLAMHGHGIDWFEGLVVELSHNQSLPEAMKQLWLSGFYYYDEKLLTETRLAHYVGSMVTALKYYIPNQELEVQSGLLDLGPVSMKGSDLANLLEQRAPSFAYNFESGEASGIAELSADLLRNNKTLPYLFNAGNKFFQWAMSAPPEASPPEMGGPGDLDMAGPPDADTAGPDTDAGAEPGFDTDIKKMDGGDTVPAPSPPPPDSESTAPRYLQAGIGEGTDPEDFIKTALLPQRQYQLVARIGYADSAWQQDTHAPVPADMVFDKSENISEPILITFQSNFSEKTQSDHLLLKRTGNTAAVVFSFTTGAAGVALTGKLCAFHQNRLIQEAEISAGVLESGAAQGAGETVNFRVVFCARRQLDNPRDRTPFGTSLIYESGMAEGAGMSGVTGQKPVDLNYSSGLEQLVKKIKKDIEYAVVNIDDHPEDLYDDNNVALLRRLAYKGNSLYVNYLGKKEGIQGPLQLVTRREEFVPLDFVYTLPVPEETAVLCTHARKALESGKCMNCFDKTQSPAPHICPFGFWSFSQVVERHSAAKTEAGGIADFSLMAEPSAGRNLLQVLHNTLFAASDQVEAATPGLNQRVADTISALSAQAEEADDWTEWTLKAQQNRDSLILLVHIEENKNLGEDQLEIGKAKFLIKNQLDHTRLQGAGSTQPPLVVVLGCEANDIENHGFDIAAQLIHQGAAIVLTNFTKIRGRHAGPVAIKLVEFLAATRGKEFTFGEIVLKLRQHLLAAGLMASLALVAYGDADWKIRV